MGWVRRRQRPLLGIAALLLVAGACIPIAWYALFGTYMPYDDEGYFLVSTKLVAQGHRLYDDVVTSYGPFYYLTFAPLFKLIGTSLETGRETVLVLWLAGCAACAWVVRRLTGSGWAALAAFAVEFKVMSALIAEPMNPAGLLNLLLFAALACGASAAPSPGALAAIGALGAAAALVKINIGGYALIAAAFAVVATSSGPRARWAAGVLAFAAVPLAVLSRDLGTGGNSAYLVLVAGSGLAVAACLRSADGPGGRSLPARFAPLMAGAAGATLAVSALAVVALGASPGGLWDGIVTHALGQRDAFAFNAGVILRPTIAVAALILAGCALGRRRAPSVPAALRRPLAGAGGVLILGVLLGAGAFGERSFTPVEWGLPLAVVVVVAGRGSRRSFGRAFVAGTAVLESLYAYPVAGSQEAFAAAFLVPVGAIALSDALGRAQGRTALRVAQAFGVGLLVYFAALQPLAHWRAQYRAGTPLPFDGARQVHTDAESVARFSWLAQELRRCSSFITVPGMNSLYLFTHRPPPVFLTTAWVRSLETGRQREMAAKLAPVRSLCVVEDDPLLSFWMAGRPVPERPLVQMIRTGFRTVAVRGPDQVLARR